jgi:hypothetical protein
MTREDKYFVWSLIAFLVAMVGVSFYVAVIA